MNWNYHKFNLQNFTHTTGISMSKLLIVFVAALVWVVMLSCKEGQGEDEVVIGQETSSYERLEDGQEFAIPLKELLKRGKNLMQAQFTPIEGSGRPLTTGTGKPITDPTSPLVFPRQFNRVSARNANACAGCHNAPFGIVGGTAGFASVCNVAASRFDFATFDHSDETILRGALNELDEFVTLQKIGNFRAPPGLFGKGFIEMLSRQMSVDLQAIQTSHLGCRGILTYNL